MSRPPLKQVAELAGVSEPTVSRVINGKLGVSTKTRSRVIDALNDLGFPNPPAPTTPLRNVIGVVTGEFSNPVFTTLVDGLATELGRRGLLATVAVNEPGFASETRCIENLQESAVDGYVFVGGGHAEADGDLTLYRRLLDDERPFVFVNGKATDLPVPHIRCDETVAAQLATRHLLDLGHTKIGCILGSDRYIGTRRFIEGHLRAMTEAGIETSDDAVVQVPFTLEGGRAGATRLIQRGYSAVICGNDLMALGALRAAESLGTRLSAVGYDGTDMTALTAPALTTARQPFADMTSLIADAIAGEVAQPGSFVDTFVFEPTLVVRASTHAYDPAAMNEASDASDGSGD